MLSFRSILKCILNTTGQVFVFYIFAKVKHFSILFQNTFLVKLCSMLQKECYQIEFFTVLISATLGTYGYLVTTTIQRDWVLCLCLT